MRLVEGAAGRVGVSLAFGSALVTDAAGGAVASVAAGVTLADGAITANQYSGDEFLL